jgi:hypothetical protein
MKTTVVTSGKNSNNVTGATTTAVTAKTASPATALQPGKGIEPNKGFDNDSKPAGDKPQETVKPEAIKTETAPQAEQPKAEPTKAELREQLSQQKPVLNLEGTLKLVEELHRRKIQRDKLIGTIEDLEAFEIGQKDDAEETDSNHFQGCELTIEDDKRRQFSTKNPVIIKKVAEFIHTLCVDRLAEIEGEIFIPAN